SLVISKAGSHENEPASRFKNLLMAPRDQVTSPIIGASLGSSPVVGYVVDYGGHRLLVFTCSGNTCKVYEENTRDAEKLANK
ncbi:fimbrial protein, partial [Salmonella enterica subsp. enterica serovar Oslo]|nr:fimbrial protein [Salmonella enterica subsp. enterica serovar Oslo]